MSETSTTASTETAGTEATVTEPGAPVTEPTVETSAPEEWDGKIESLDPRVQKIIGDLRNEAGDERIASKTLSAIQKALNPDAPDEKPTAEALAAQVAEHQQTAEQAVTAQHAAEVKLAVVLASLAQDADHEALLDSKSFLATLDGLTPDDGEKITAAITNAVEKNPKFKVARAVTTSRVDTSAGSGENAITQDQFKTMGYKDRVELFQKNPTLYSQLNR